MTADDKKLLRKFINERADRARERLGRLRDQKMAAVADKLDFAALNPTQQAAIAGYNDAVQRLVDAGNKLIMLDFDPRQYLTRTHWSCSPETVEIPTLKAQNGLPGLCYFEGDNPDIPRLSRRIQEDKAKIRQAHDNAIARLDATVNEALLDLLSKNLEGIKEQLNALGAKFDSIAMVYEANGTFE